MARQLTADDAANAIWGGSVLACGGGGWVEHGSLMAGLATSIGTPTLVGVDEVPDDALVATVTAIGAPAAIGWEIRPLDYVRAFESLEQALGKPIRAVMTAQNGSSTTLNGWIQSAVKGVPVLDAAGDLRAHPTGKQGSLGLTTRPDYETVQVAWGGSRAKNGGPLEVVVRGSVSAVDDVLRDVSVRAGGFIASARNPVEASWVKEHASIGAISYALQLGDSMRVAASSGAEAILEAVLHHTKGEVIARGTASLPEPVRTSGGFDHGTLVVGDAQLRFLNEYMAVDYKGERIATYPDVITTLSLEDGRPVAIKDLRDGLQLAVVVVDRKHFSVSSSASDRLALAEVQDIMGVDLLTHL